MALSLTPRKITEVERNLMRRDGQWSELFVAVDQTPQVFTATLDLAALPTSNESVASIKIISGHFQGDYNIAHAGMTIWVGSAEGLCDLGRVRLRKMFTSSASVLDIGETSDIEWVVDPQVDRFLTIVDEFLIWPRLLRVVGPTVSSGSGVVAITSGTTKVYGDVSGSADIVSTSSSSTNVTFVGGTGFTFIFAAGDWIKADFGSPYNTSEYRRITSVVSDSILIVDSPFSYTSTPSARAIKTRFLTECKPGSDLTIGTQMGTVASVISNRELNMITPWTADLSAYGYSITSLDIYMDYDEQIVANSVNRHYLYPSPPVPIMGGPIVIDHLQENAIVIPLTAAGSYSLDSTIPAYSWQTTNGTLSSMTSATPTLTVNTAGVYRISCFVGGGGVGSWGHRKIHVFDKAHPPLTVTKLESFEGSDDGGWSARLTVYGNVSQDQIRDQAQIILFSRDHYGSTQQAIGQNAASANVKLVGWIVGETITIDPELNQVTFDVQGAQYWLDKITGVATAMEDMSVEPVLWTQMYHLTVDRALWHFFVWRTTFTLCCDLHLTSNIQRLKFLEGKLGSLASQVDQIAKQVILARAVCDRLSRMIIEVNPQMIPSAARTTPVVQHFEPQDLRAPLSLQVRKVNEVSRMTVSGTAWDGATATGYVSAKPKGVFKTHGRPDSIPNLAIDNQDQADRLASLALANRNNPYPSVPVPISGLNTLLDIAPAMYITQDAQDNSRGLDLSQLPVLIKRISHSYDPMTGVFTTNIEGEGYTDESTRLEGAPPSLPFSF
jgi:hypothetical protein